MEQIANERNNSTQKAMEEIQNEYNKNQNITILKREDWHVCVSYKDYGIFHLYFDKNVVNDIVKMDIRHENTQKIGTYSIDLKEYASRRSIDREIAFYEKYLEIFIREHEIEKTGR